MGFDVASLQALSRMANIFGPPASPPQDPFGNMGMMPMGGMQEQPFDMGRRMAELYQPQNQMQDRFSSLLDQFPQRENPSGLRKLGAVLYGFGQGAQGNDPLRASQSFANAPYYNKLADWQTQVEPLNKAADNERLMNTQNRMYANQVATQEQRDRQLTEAERKNRALETDKEVMRKRQQQLADLKVWQANNPNQQLKVIDGEAYIFNPQGGLEPTGIKGLTKEDEINLAAAHAMNRVQVQQAGATERTGMQQSGATERTGMQQEGATTRTGMQQTGAMNRTQFNVLNRPIGGGSTSPNVTQNARARQAVSEHPEWAPYIKRTASGQFIGVEAPKGSSGFFGMGATQGGDPAIVKQINDYIFGNSSRGNVPSNQQPNSPANTPITSGRISVIGPNGEKGSVPANQLQQALAQGYKQVK